MKHLLIGLLFFASAFAQQTAQIREIKVPYMSAGELSATVLPVGTMAFSEGDPTKLYIGDGATPGGRRVSEPTPRWDHSATTNISLNGNYLNLGSGFVLHQLGGYAAISGQGQIVASPGVSTWGDSFTPFIQITGGNTLGQITGFVWDPIASLFTATILDADAGAPSIQWTNNLVTGVWASHTATVTGPSAGSYTATFAIPAGQTTAFFRATYPTGSTGKIELLNTTEITGSLSVSAGITGSLNATNLTGAVTSAQLSNLVNTSISKGVTAHGWGDHATAGYLTALPATVSQAEAEAGTVTDPRTWTPQRVKQAIVANAPAPAAASTTTAGLVPGIGFNLSAFTNASTLELELGRRIMSTRTMAGTSINGGGYFSGGAHTRLNTVLAINSGYVLRTPAANSEYLWNIGGSSANRINWDRPIGFSFFFHYRVGTPTTHVFRAQFGKKDTTSPEDLDKRGIGYNLIGTRLWLVAHNGTAPITKVDSGVDLVGGVTSRIDVFSDGSGNVALRHNGLVVAASNQGPTGLDPAHGFFAVECDSGATATSVWYEMTDNFSIFAF
jgi:hypothetical protein